MSSFLLCFLGALSAAAVFTFTLWRVGGIAQDVPNERSSHVVPTPRGGGVAFFAAFFLALVGVFFWKRELLTKEQVVLATMWLTVGCLGFLEDRFGVPAKIRLLVQLVSAIVLAAAGFFWEDLGIFGLSFISPAFFSIPVSVLFIVWVTNLYNFMDGINGIAAIQGLVSSALFLIVGFISHNEVLVATSGLLFFSILGFLPFNFPKAKIFMGDSGSLFLGFLFATLPFLSDGIPSLSMEFVAVSIGPFLADTLFTLVIRIKRRENLGQAHRSHFYQKFQMLTGSHTVATLTYGCFGLLFAFVSLLRLYASRGTYVAALTGSLIVLGGFFIWVYRAYERRGASKG